MITLTLSEPDAEILKDVLDVWIEGHEPATQDVIQDRSLDDFDQMLDAVDGMRQQFNEIVTIRELLWMQLRKDRDDSHGRAS